VDHHCHDNATLRYRGYLCDLREFRVLFIVAVKLNGMRQNAVRPYIALTNQLRCSGQPTSSTLTSLVLRYRTGLGGRCWAPVPKKRYKAPPNTWSRTLSRADSNPCPFTLGLRNDFQPYALFYSPRMAGHTPTSLAIPDFSLSRAMG